LFNGKKYPSFVLEIVIAWEALPAGRQGSNLDFFNEIAAVDATSQ